MLHVGIDARVGEAMGGVAQVATSLVHALGKLDDDSVRFTIITTLEREADWLRRFLGPNQRLVVKPAPPPPTRLARGRSALGRAARPLLDLARPPAGVGWPQVPLSDGFYESLGLDVLHFPHQFYVLTALPTVYNPHDVQHLHYPQFFTAAAIARKEVVYGAGCHFAQAVPVASQWIKDDLRRWYHLDADKVQVIPLGPPTETYAPPSAADLAAVRARYGLPETFAFFPAVTWPHKNHLRLFEALALLRDRRGLVVPLVCTGARHEQSWPRLRAKLDELGLDDQVRFLGFVSETDLRALYRLAHLLVMPTLFESDSFPVFEAWADRLPVASSNVTALPDQILDAGLLFDPLDPEDIAAAIERIVGDAGLRAHLVERGVERLADYSWERTARAYVATYRRVAGERLSADEKELLSWNWMLEPRRHGRATATLRRAIPVAAPVLAGNERAYVNDCLDSTWISSAGKYLDRFEAAFAQVCGVKHALSCCNGTAALHLAVMALGLQPGDEVIVPTLTYIATANAVAYCGGRPVFVDSDPETWTLSIEDVERKITPRTRGIIVVHLYGHPADMDAIRAVAQRHGLWVLEDAAEAGRRRSSR